MRGILLLILMLAGTAAQGQGLAKGKDYKASDVIDAVRCLKVAVSARIIQTNYNVSSDGMLFMRGIQQDPKSRDNVKDTYYLFDERGHAKLCNRQFDGRRNEPPRGIDVSESVQEKDRERYLRDCPEGGDQYIGYLMQEVKTMIEKLDVSMKVATKQKNLDDAVSSAESAEYTGKDEKEKKRKKTNALRRIRESISGETYQNILSQCSSVNDDEVRKTAKEQQKKLDEAFRKSRREGNDEKLKAAEKKASDIGT